MNAENFLKNFHDFLAPQLDTYEQAIYLYAVRHSRLIDQPEVVIPLRSFSQHLARGVGQKGGAIADVTCYKKVRSLESKGIIKVLNSERKGTRLHVFLPEEIEGLITQESQPIAPCLDDMDFFNIPENRKFILNREDHKCFYCLRQLDDENYVMEHVQSRPKGDCSYRNIVAACRRCNNRKDSLLAKDHLRTLYREGFLSDSELENRISHLELLLDGELKPDIEIG